MDDLVAALKKIGRPVCLSAAKKLEDITPNAARFDLHLRHADLDAQDASFLATAIHKTANTPGPALRSFSASYSPRLTDAGIAALADAFPANMIELGLVGSACTDIGGRAILGWAQRATNPTMICIESNDISPHLKSLFAPLRQHHPSIILSL